MSHDHQHEPQSDTRAGRVQSPGADEDAVRAASKMGELPDPFAAFLLVVATGGACVLGWFLGYGAELLLGLSLTGVIAGGSVRVTLTENVPRRILGTTVLWTSGIVFVAVTVFTVYRYGLVGAAAFIQAVVVTASVFLVPFGITTTTIRTYGYGAGQRVLKQYLGATLILSVLFIAYAVFQVFAINISGVLESVLGTVGTQVQSSSLIPQVTVSTFAYLFFLGSLYAFINRFPYEMFISPEDVDTVDGWRKTLLKACKIAAVVTAAWLPASASVVNSDSPAMVQMATASIIRGMSVDAVVFSVLAVAVLLALLTVLIVTVRKATAVSETSLLPPLVITVGVGVASLLGHGMITSALASPAIQSTMRDLPFGSTLLSGDVSLLLLGVTVIAILASGILFSIPTIIASSNFVDPAFAGVIASVGGITLLTIVGAFRGANLLVLISGVAVIAFVWEFGEFTTVATGELTPETDGELSHLSHGVFDIPTGLGALAATHIVTTIAVIAVGSMAAFALTAVSTSIVTVLSVAVVVLTATVLATVQAVSVLSG